MSPDEPDGPPRVTAIKRRPRGRVTVTTSDGETLTVHAEAAEQSGLREGDHLDGTARERIEREEQRCMAHEASLRLLSHRPRSERELGQRLRLRGIAPDVVEEEVERLRDAGLLDDEAFAQSWVGERQSSAPREASVFCATSCSGGGCGPRSRTKRCCRSTTGRPRWRWRGAGRTGSPTSSFGCSASGSGAFCGGVGSPTTTSRRPCGRSGTRPRRSRSGGSGAGFAAA